MLASRWAPGAHTGWALAGLALASVAGIAWQLQQPQLWPLVWDQALTGGALAGLAALWCWPAFRRGTAGGLLAAACLAALALGSTGWRAHDRLAERLPAALEGQDVLVTGSISSLPQRGPSGLRFQFDVEGATLQGRPVALPSRLALGWYNGFADELPLDDPRADLRGGQRWQLPLRLKRPHGSANPGGFDSELWWFDQGIGATGYVRVVARGPAAQLLQRQAAHPLLRLRQAIRDAIERQVPDARAAGVLAALVVGDQAAIDRDDWLLFRQTGIAHLVAISGVHVTMFAWLAAAGVAALWRRSRRAMRACPAPLAARLGGVLLAAAYALLAGWGVPSQRTVVMLAAAALLRHAGAGWPWLLVLLLAGVAVTALDPWALLQAGFWLSFVAVGLLMLSEPVHGKRAAPRPQAGDGRWAQLRASLSDAVRSHGQAQLVATLGLAPLSLVFFQQLSVVGLLANLGAIPLVTLLITPLALAGVLVPVVWQGAAALVQAGVWLLGGLQHWPGAVWVAAAAPAWAVACGLAAAVLGVLPVPWRLRLLGVPLALPLLAPVVPRPAEGRFELLAADVGQGTAVLLRTRAHLLVYDTGPQYARDSDAGQRVLLPLLQHRGERRIDRLVLSHRDSDHVGGAASLMAALPVGDLFHSLEDGHPLLAGAVAARRCLAGDQWQWDGVRFTVLHPTAEDNSAQRKPNDVSCVLRVADAAGHSVLLTGDIEAPQEAALLARHGAAVLASTVLLVPHHGSKTSSSPAFLAAVQPSWAVVQAGYRSRFGHPAPPIVARYAEGGLPVVRTDRCGAWQWDGVQAVCQRTARRRYWHDDPGEAAQ
jgi:competence protein ComEC